MDEAGRLAVLRARLAAPMPEDRPWGWLGPLLVTAFGAFLRFDRLRVPKALIFDETYYAKDAWSILKHGVELKLLKPEIANPMIVAGHTNFFAPCDHTSACGEYVVQPEVGKLLIAVGEWLFGLNPFGWRFASAVFGSLAILLICRIARRMTRSTLLGCVAGLLMSLDGLEFVLSRTGILDIFLMFFVLAAFGCILIDRDTSRARLAELVARHPGRPGGPRLGLRKWQLAAGVFLGLAVATKWNAAWYILGFAMLFLAWEIGARRAAGLKSFVRGGLRETVWLPLTFIVVPLAVYIASWSGWFATSTGYDRDYAQAHGVHTPVISALYSLFEYHREAIGFGLGLKLPHPYQSQPWDWLLLGVLAGWGPWFPLVTRTKFYYYALEFEPFLILSIVLCLGLILGPATAGVLRRSVGAGVAGAYLLCVLLMFWYFYPVLAGSIIPYDDWLSHMWYQVGGHGWI